MPRPKLHLTGETSAVDWDRLYPQPRTTAVAGSRNLLYVLCGTPPGRDELLNTFSRACNERYKPVISERHAPTTRRGRRECAGAGFGADIEVPARCAAALNGR